MDGQMNILDIPIGKPQVPGTRPPVTRKHKTQKWIVTGETRSRIGTCILGHLTPFDRDELEVFLCYMSWSSVNTTVDEFK